jgi:hypothetical protein
MDERGTTENPYASPSAHGGPARPALGWILGVIVTTVLLQLFGTFIWFEGGMGVFVKSYTLDSRVLKLEEVVIFLPVFLGLGAFLISAFVGGPPLRAKWLWAAIAVVVVEQVVAIGLWVTYAALMLPNVSPRGRGEFVVYFTLVMITLHLVRGSALAAFLLKSRNRHADNQKAREGS